MKKPQTDLLQGTLDLLVLKAGGARLDRRRVRRVREQPPGENL
jgi:hypothetical protein